MGRRNQRQLRRLTLRFFLIVGVNQATDQADEDCPKVKVSAMGSKVLIGVPAWEMNECYGWNMSGSPTPSFARTSRNIHKIMNRSKENVSADQKKFQPLIWIHSGFSRILNRNIPSGDLRWAEKHVLATTAVSSIRM